MTQPSQNSAHSINKHLLIGLFILVCLLGGLGGWAAIASISGAVIAQGNVVVETSAKRIQHKEGGIIGEILIRNGDHVSAGDILVRLDDTLTKANLVITSNQLDEFLARQARLEAERNIDKEIEFPKALLKRQGELEVKKILRGEGSLFKLRRNLQKSQKGQLRSRIGQYGKEILGLIAQRDAKVQEVVFIAQELAGLEKLYADGHVSNTRILFLKRERTRLEGEKGQLIAKIASTRGMISETELQLMQIDQKFLSDVVQELRSVQAKIVELVESEVAYKDRLRRGEIRSPRSGYVHQLNVHTIGGVISPGETLALIVPEEDKLFVDARLDPTSIDQVHVGQEATLRFSAFNQRSTPEVTAVLHRVSPDLSHDEKTGFPYYQVRIRLNESELEKLGDKNLVPGMPVEVFFQTADRKAISYLLKPLSDQIMRTFREE